MKTLISLITLLILTLSLKPTLAQAHLLESDHDIGAVLHVDPNDNPIAGSQASFFFEFKDKTNNFTPATCECTFLVLENGKTIYSQPLFQNTDKPSLTNASVFYTFPKKDVYQIKVTGKPETPGAFQPFTLTWSFRVDESATKASSKSNFLATHLIHIVTAVIGIALLIWLFFRQEIQSKKKNTKKGGDKHAEKNNSVE
jgi:hypothetical protein